MKMVNFVQNTQSMILRQKAPERFLGLVSPILKTKNRDGTLNIYNNGKTTKISDDVNSFVAEDEKNISYLTNYDIEKEKGDAMLYNGSDKRVKVDSDVAVLLWKRDLIDVFYLSFLYLEDYID